MPCGVFIIQHVDPADVTMKVALFQANDPAPLNVTSTADGSGTFTIVVTFPPCPAGTTHSNSAPAT